MPSESHAGRISALAMNRPHSSPVRAFSIITAMGPSSMAIYDEAHQSCDGLNASRKPNGPHRRSPYCRYMALSAASDCVGTNGIMPSDAVGANVPLSPAYGPRLL